MVRPRLFGRRTWWALLALPALLWGLMLLLAPTGWVKARLTARLEAATGRAVRIGSVHLGLLGHLRLDDLSFAEHATPADPWLRVREARVDLHPGQVICGRCQPGDVVVDGVSLRVWRRPDGRFEFGNLARSPLSGAAGSSPNLPTPASHAIPPINLQVENATIQFVDDPNRFRATFVAVSGRGAFRPLSVQIDELRGVVNGGPFRLAARVDRDPASPDFTLEMQASKVHLDRGLEMIQNLVPIVSSPGDAIGGQVNLRLALRARGGTCPEIRRTLIGHGSVLLDPIDLDGSQILAELRSLGDWPASSHVAAVSSTFEVGGGRISTNDLTIRASKVPFIVAGWSDFDGRFQYETRVDQMLAKVPREARSVLGELNINLDDLIGLRIEKDCGPIQLTVRGRPLKDEPGRNPGERTRSRATARRIRDGFFR